jgi:hypothetical protein
MQSAIAATERSHAGQLALRLRLTHSPSRFEDPSEWRASAYAPFGVVPANALFCAFSELSVRAYIHVMLCVRAAVTAAAATKLLTVRDKCEVPAILANTIVVSVTSSVVTRRRPRGTSVDLDSDAMERRYEQQIEMKSVMLLSPTCKI